MSKDKRHEGDDKMAVNTEDLTIAQQIKESMEEYKRIDSGEKPRRSVMDIIQKIKKEMNEDGKL